MPKDTKLTEGRRELMTIINRQTLPTVLSDLAWICYDQSTSPLAYQSGSSEVRDWRAISRALIKAAKSLERAGEIAKDVSYAHYPVESIEPVDSPPPP